MTNPLTCKLKGHPLDFRIPSSGQITEFYLISPCKSKRKTPFAKAISITQGFRKEDCKWIIHFELKDMKYESYFDDFSRKMFESTKQISDIFEGPDAVLAFFNDWKKMLSTEELKKEDVQGLIGELWFLKNYMIPQYGENDAVGSWTRASFGKQDFIINGSWYEIKTAGSSATEITISSLEQLNNPNDGHLVVIKIQESSKSSSTALDLNYIYDDIRQNFKEPYAKSLYDDALDGYNLPNSMYDDIKFEIFGMVHYIVNDSFPKLLPDDMPEGVHVKEYSINIDSINSHRES